MGSHGHYLRTRERIETVSTSIELGGTMKVALMDATKKNQAAALKPFAAAGLFI